jgi:hypothetical protein
VIFIIIQTDVVGPMKGTMKMKYKEDFTKFWFISVVIMAKKGIRA